MFKAGDKVRRKQGGTFSNDEYIVTVDRVEDGIVWLLETKSHAPTTYVTLVDECKEEKHPEVEKSIEYLEQRLLSLKSEEDSIKNAIEVLKAI